MKESQKESQLESNQIHNETQSERRIFTGLSSIMDQLLLNEESKRQLRVGRILDRINGTLSIDETTPVSRHRRLEDGTSQILLGDISFRKEDVDRFGWGVDTPKEQLVIKLAHESSHAFQLQTGYESALISFLNGSNDIDEKFHPYLELYTFLNAKGICNGLANSNIYHQQNRGSGLLNMTTLEDITEFMGAYLISDTYFNFRLDGSRILLTDEERIKVSHLIIQIVGE